jgi:hypothetical protein
LVSRLIETARRQIMQKDAELRTHPSPHPIEGANSRLHFWQAPTPGLSVLGCDDCSPTNLACRKTACFDLATDCRETNIVLTRELTERIGLFHVDPESPQRTGRLCIANY